MTHPILLTHYHCIGTPRRFSEHNCEATKMQLHAINILFLGESVRSTENIKLNWQQKLRVICVKTSTVGDRYHISLRPATMFAR